MKNLSLIFTTLSLSFLLCNTSHASNLAPLLEQYKKVHTIAEFYSKATTHRLSQLNHLDQNADYENSIALIQKIETNLEIAKKILCRKIDLLEHIFNQNIPRIENSSNNELRIRQMHLDYMEIYHFELGEFKFESAVKPVKLSNKIKKECRFSFNRLNCLREFLSAGSSKSLLGAHEHWILNMLKGNTETTAWDIAILERIQAIEQK